MAKYNVGDKVEVRFQGEWIEGTYAKDYSIYSNMQATPHSVSIKTPTTSGSSAFADADVRPWSGTLKPLVAPDPTIDPATVDTNALEQAIIDEINTMRANPAAYADKLAALKNNYIVVDRKQWYLNMPHEGGKYIANNQADSDDHEKWLDETIAALRQSPVLTQLRKDDRLRQAADFLASDTGETHEHNDSQNRDHMARAQAAGYTGGVNECLSSGNSTAFGAVVGFLIDWRVESRGHRTNLMNPDTKTIGVACHFFPKEEIKNGEYTITKGNYIRTVIQCGYGQ